MLIYSGINQQDITKISSFHIFLRFSFTPLCIGTLKSVFCFQPDSPAEEEHSPVSNSPKECWFCSRAETESGITNKQKPTNKYTPRPPALILAYLETYCPTISATETAQLSMESLQQSRAGSRAACIRALQPRACRAVLTVPIDVNGV